MAPGLYGQVHGGSHRDSVLGLGDLLAEGPGYVVEARDAGEADRGALAAFHARMDDDMDTPGALAGIFELVTAAIGEVDEQVADSCGKLMATARKRGHTAEIGR